jgi:hypothetical protein
MAKKTIKQLKDLSRWELVNFYHLHVENDTSKFFISKIWNWVGDYLKNRFGGKEDFRFYPNDGDNGVYRLLTGEDDKTVITIASDWATDTPDSALIGKLMKDENADYSLHLGDVYFVGKPEEIEANFGKKGDDNDYGDWAKGSKGFLAIPGNHEFYSTGIGFYDNLLSKTFIQKSDTTTTKQKAGFFCLENQHWRIIGLDTGYTSVGVPIVEFFVKPDCKLSNEQVAWLINDVKLNNPNDKRGLIILSHHQYFSAFEGGEAFPKPAKQLAELMGEARAKMPVIWYWGHQHLLSFYKLNNIGSGIPAYGRCIGHGGMPVTIHTILKSADIQCAIDNKLLYYDLRFQKFDEKTQLGYNGYVRMTLDGDTMIAEHIQNELNSETARTIVMTEKWKIDLDTGVLSFELTDDINTPLTKFTAPTK